jgi:hypothetical protein
MLKRETFMSSIPGGVPSRIVENALEKDAEVQIILDTCLNLEECAHLLKSYCFRLPCLSNGICRMLILMLLDEVEWNEIAEHLLAGRKNATAAHH